MKGEIYSFLEQTQQWSDVIVLLLISGIPPEDARVSKAQELESNLKKSIQRYSIVLMKSYTCTLYKQK